MKAISMRVAGALALAFLPGLAMAWSSAGHQAVGAIADRLLEGSHAGEMVRKTLGGMDLKTVAVWADCVKGTTSKDGVSFSYRTDPQRFAECQPFASEQEQARIIAFVKANWTQCGSAQGNEWCHSQYHYADVAPQRDHYDPHFAGANDHDVVHSIGAMLTVLGGGKAPAPFAIADRREALMLLAHYVGDLHQPLHIASIYLDVDGKPVDPDAVGLDPRTDTAGGNMIYDGGKRMHAYWDSIPKRLEAGGESFEETLALARKVASSGGSASSWAAQWAGEVIQTGRVAYDGLTFKPRAPQEAGPGAPSWDAEGMNADYFKRAERYKQTELALAGARLAQAIQAIWPEPEKSAKRREVPLRLIAFNDFHGNLEAGSLSLTLADPLAPGQSLKVPVGGAAALAGMIGQLRKETGNSLVLSGGDLFGASPLVSTLFRHESTVSVMNRIGVDIGIVGNHEFDAGIAEIKRLEKGGCAAAKADEVAASCVGGKYEGMKFPLLGGNVHKEGSRTPVFSPWVIRKVGGIPVGFIGVVTRETPSVVVRSSIEGLVFDDEAESINRSARALRARGVRAIVAMVHEGGDIGREGETPDWNDTSCPNARGAIFDIAKRVSKDVDLIFSAHTHKGYRCLIDGRLVIQATNYGRGVSVVDLALDPQSRDIDRARSVSANLPVVGNRTSAAQRAQLARTLPPAFAGAVLAAQPDEAVAARVEAYAKAVAPKVERPVGRIAAAFPRSNGKHDSPAGRLIADSQLAAAKLADDGRPQIAFLNEGGIRSDLECRGTPPCEVSFGQVFTMQPFGNNLVIMSLSGAQIRQALEQQQAANATSPQFLQPSAGFSYEWLNAAPAGQHVGAIRLNGEALDMAKTYRVVVNNFLSEGGDGFLVFRDGTERKAAGQDLDAMLAWLQPSLTQDAAIRGPAPEAAVSRQ